MDPLYAEGDFGAGQSVDLVEDAPFLASDISTYQKCYGTHVPVKTIVVDTPLGSASTEDEVDIEDLISLVPKINDIYVYEAPENTANGATIVNILTAIEHADNARIVSDSWGGCETAAGNAQIAQGEAPVLQLMVAQGQDFFSASGDSGSTECSDNMTPELGVQDPSSQPYAIGVGGTNLTELGNPPAVAPTETAWVNGGGGISSLWPMGPFQLGPEKGVINSYSSRVPCSAPSGAYCREVPDVSANAGYGYAVFVGPGKWGHIGGTSLAAPTWAAATALIYDSSPSCRTSPPVLDGLLYLFAAGLPLDFNDVTKGNNDNNVKAVHGKYPATKYYDLATGLGTPEAANLAQTLCGTPALWSPQTTAPGFSDTTSPVAAVWDHTVYVAATNSADHVVYASFDGTTWSSVSELKIGKTAVVTPYSPSITENSGTLMMAWTSKSDHDVEVSALRHHAWTKATVVGAGKAVSDHGPSLTANGGNPAIAWKGDKTDRVFVSIEGSKGWSAQLTVTGASTAIRPDVVFYKPASSYVIAWTTNHNAIKYTDLSVFGFGSVATVPQAGTNNSPALGVLDNYLFVAWKGHTTDKVFYSSQPPGKIFGTWASQESEPAALTTGFPSLAATGPTLYTFWLGKSGAHLWYQFSDATNR
jgi:hypothetical protein